MIWLTNYFFFYNLYSLQSNIRKKIFESSPICLPKHYLKTVHGARINVSYQGCRVIEVRIIETQLYNSINTGKIIVENFFMIINIT